MADKRLRIVLQARTSSSRLPGKVLLPLAGMPLALLCAKRLARAGREVLVATSTNADDDQLALLLAQAAIHCFRGSLHDVLGRFGAAVVDMADEDIVVRMTADNPVPDGVFIRACEQLWSADVDYLGTHSPFDGLPYGLGAELMTVAALRHAVLEATDAYDREHVTPWIRRNQRVGRIARNSLLATDLSHLRCTIDTYDDYVRMQHVFGSLQCDPVAADWTDIVERLRDVDGAPKFRVPYVERDGAAESRMALGTAQMGLPYGATNHDGQPNEPLAILMVRKAVEHGVTWIDTARAYGSAEGRVGRALQGSWRNRTRVISKLDPLNELATDASAACASEAVAASTYQSMHELGVDRLDVLLLHRWAHRSSHQGAIWSRLLALRDQGLIRELGASIYQPEEALAALVEPDLRHLQIPFNLLDHRWRAVSFCAAVAARPDVQIHVRSIFLQGILLGDVTTWPAFDAKGAGILRQLDALVVELGLDSRAALCVAFVLAHPWVSSVVLGVETMNQLEQNLGVMNTLPLSAAQTDAVVARLAGASERLLNPAQWNQP